MNEALVTMAGWVSNKPMVRQIRNGSMVCNFWINATPQRWDTASGEWQDEDTLHFRVSCWRQLARNAAESIAKGDPVVVYGKLTIRRRELDGRVRVSNEIEAYDLGPNLNYGRASFRFTSGGRRGEARGRAADPAKATREAVREMRREAAREAVREGTREVAREVAGEVTRESTEEVARETGVDERAA